MTTMAALSSAAAAADEAEPLVHVSFNSTGTHFVAATASGIRVFSCSTNPLKHEFSKSFPYPDAATGSSSRVVTADLATSGALAAVVFRPEPSAADLADDEEEEGGDRIRYCSHELRGQIATTLALGDDVTPTTSSSSSSSVRAVRHSHSGNHVLVVVSGAGNGKATLYDTSSRRPARRCMELDTGPNPLGVCALAVDGSRKSGGETTAAVVACPCPAAKGHVQVCRRRRGGTGGGPARVDVRAHSSRVVCVALSLDGRLLATASSKGTVVRLFTSADGNKVNELRRGVDRADIYSMAFSTDSKWLAVSSDKGTIHVFSVNVDVPSPSPSPSSPAQEDSNDPDSDSPNAGSALDAKQGSSSWSFLSGFVPGYFKQDGSLAKFRLREGVEYVVAFGNGPNTILVVGMDGSFYRCVFDPVKGGDMKQLEYRDFMKMK